MDRVTGWKQEVADPEMTPELRDRDRELLSGTLEAMSATIRTEASVEQLLHGEPHPGNVLDTRKGPLWIDVGTLQRGPVEYDLAYAPDDVAGHYPAANQRFVGKFRILMWAGHDCSPGLSRTNSDEVPDLDPSNAAATGRGPTTLPSRILAVTMRGHDLGVGGGPESDRPGGRCWSCSSGVAAPS